VVAPGKAQSVAGLDFVGYGSHTNAYPHTYLTAAAAIGTRPSEAEDFARRLIKSYREFKQDKGGRQGPAEAKAKPPAPVTGHQGGRLPPGQDGPAKATGGA
jgi:hypothetical protein